jgi:hypothetical protein
LNVSRLSLSLSCCLFLVKWMNAVFEDSKMAPLSFSHVSSTGRISFWMTLVFSSADSPTIHARCSDDDDDDNS